MRFVVDADDVSVLQSERSGELVSRGGGRQDELSRSREDIYLISGDESPDEECAVVGIDQIIPFALLVRFRESSDPYGEASVLGGSGEGSGIVLLQEVGISVEGVVNEPYVPVAAEGVFVREGEGDVIYHLVIYHWTI
jgi:hypothetical protein